MRKIHQVSEGRVVLKVYRDVEWGEYVVRLFIDGKENIHASYHTDDKQDAISTAEFMLRAATDNLKPSDFDPDEE